jgi:hypothetical protein
MVKSMKDEILKLRKEGKTYNEIKEITGASKATISYHCQKNGLDGRIDGGGLKNKDIDEMKEFYKTHTLDETSKKFNIGKTNLKKIIEKKQFILTEDERQKRPYKYIKTFRRKNKDRAIQYKGGECVTCGYNNCNSALEFHHLDPNVKDFNLSQNRKK